MQWNALHNCIGTTNLWFHFTGWKPSEAVRQITCGKKSAAPVCLYPAVLLLRLNTCRQNSVAPVCLYPAVLLLRLITCRQKIRCACLPLPSRSSATADHLPAKIRLRLSAFIQPFFCCGRSPAGKKSAAPVCLYPAVLLLRLHLLAKNPLRPSAFIPAVPLPRRITSRQKSPPPVSLYPAVLLLRQITCRQKIRYARLPLSSRSSAAADHLPATSPLRLSAFIQPFLCRG
ncbi:hypothetical protein PM3016_1723 [Paenibacillus mucilaginosus 3016]|uniref:Uncharacterized protein n=1 Tax=Paenibacillus mucilaginosus 3016 TaxID=1116391 RepID=H6NEU4_9BACL|nr:hypothetical protein [Paenibacillus mucilaginosus]AFC28635.1 hypothetical protein PM3016_1723 [Paenibacillus mucilaginosus 3016]WFA17415.1 hypothetical protein ERY13_09060 [Paenibacillus mucilaginosus]